MRGIHTPEVRPAAPRVVEQLKVADVVGDEDPAILIGECKVFIITGTLGVELPRS